MRLWQRLLNSWREPEFWTQPAHLPPFPVSAVLGDREEIENDFDAYVRHAYKENGVVFSCILVRLLVLSEARFLWRRFEDSRPTQPFGNQELALLERPWPNATTGELIAHMEQDASLGGNFYATTVGSGESRRIRRLRPDWVTVVTGVPRRELTDPDEEPSPFDIRARPVAYVYDPRWGRQGGNPVTLTPDQIVHYSPIPDPAAQWRGMSWITPIVREVQGDSAATTHKLNFFRNGATPGFAISYDKTLSREAVEEYVELFKTQHEGASNAYRTLHLGGGAEPHTVGATMEQLDLKATQGAGETRIIMAGGLHPVVVGASEGMQGSSLNAGNFNSARRKVADGTFRPLWRMMAASLESLVTPPDRGAHLWYDARDVAFLRQDAKDEAEIKSADAATINQLITSGFTAESAVAAVQTGDWSRLDHTGLVSVQLTPPNDAGNSEPVNVPANLAPRLLADGWRLAHPNGHQRRTPELVEG